RQPMADVASSTTGMPARRLESLRANLPPGWATAVVVAAAWAVLIVVSGLHRADFISHQTVLAVTFTMAITGVLAVAQALIGISGAILDLSQPAGLILSASLVANLLERGWPVWAAVIAGIAAGALWGFGNALIIVLGKLNPIIVTLGTNFILGAVMFLIWQNAQVPLSSSLTQFGQDSLLGLPSTLWPMVVLVLVVGFLLPRTRY